MRRSIVDRLRDFSVKLRDGVPIEAVQVTVEHTPDGPLSSQKHVVLTPKKCRFEVWIICTRGTGHNWRKMETFDTRKEADDLIAWHKELDAKFPQGHYRYKIEPIPVE